VVAQILQGALQQQQQQPQQRRTKVSYTLSPCR
jgi:hypothetical protein